MIKNKAFFACSKLAVCFTVMLVLLFSFSACAPSDHGATQQPSQRPTLTEAELDLLKNRTAEEIINSASNTPYHRLITERIDSSMFEQRYDHGSDVSHAYMPTSDNFPKGMDLEQLNKKFPVQCIRKIDDDRYYVLYLNDNNEHIVVFLKYSVNKSARVTKVINFNELDIVTVPSDVTVLENNADTMADLLEMVPSLKGLVGANACISVRSEGSGTVKTISCIAEGWSSIYFVVDDDSGHCSYPVDYDADPQKVKLKFEDYGWSILVQDYPQ